MKLLTHLAALALLFSPLGSQAGLLSIENSTEQIEKVTLAKAAVVQIDEQPIPLSSVGAGLRAKKVLFINVHVYVAQLFVSKISDYEYSPTGALDSLKDQNVSAIQLHFLRDVDADNVQKSFKEALKVNEINLEDPSIKQFLETVAKGGEAQKGKTLTILGVRSGDSETISYETTSGNITQIKGEEGFIKDIFSIWLGKPSDEGVANLKKAFTQLK